MAWAGELGVWWRFGRIRASYITCRRLQHKVVGVRRKMMVSDSGGTQRLYVAHLLEMNSRRRTIARSKNILGVIVYMDAAKSFKQRLPAWRWQRIPCTNPATQNIEQCSTQRKKQLYLCSCSWSKYCGDRYVHRANSSSRCQDRCYENTTTLRHLTFLRFLRHRPL
jgi:hypothetical protein